MARGVVKRTIGYGPPNPTHEDWRERSQKDILRLIKQSRKNCVAGIRSVGLDGHLLRKLAKKYNVHPGNIIQQQAIVLVKHPFGAGLGPSRADEIKARKETQRY